MNSKAKINILMVDDDPANLLSLEAILADLDQNLVRASSGEDALRCVLREDYAVILLDVRLPGIDGFETASLIRSRPQSRETPIIFLTGMSQDATLTFRGYEVGAVDYIVKPLVPQILKSKVSVFIDLYNKTCEIARQEEKYRKIFESFPDIYFSINPQAEVTLISPSLFGELGYMPAEITGSAFATLFSDALSVPPLIRLLEQTGSIKEQECALRSKEGGILEFSLNAHVVRSPDGQTLAMEGALHNITDRKEMERLRAEESQREQHQILQSILDAMPDGVVVSDTDGEFLLFNPAARAIAGVTPVNLREMAAYYRPYLPDMLTPYPDDEAPLARALRGEVVDGAEVFAQFTAGALPKSSWLSFNARPLVDKQGALKGGVAIFRDITERKKNEQRLAYLARYDMLTGLPNRHMFRERFIETMAVIRQSDKLVALMFLDIDHFKSVNDSLGHEAGDQLLKAVAGRLNGCVRHKDMVARLGGDEFTVVLEGRVSVEHVTLVAQKIIDAMLPLFSLGGLELFITVSIGIVICNGDSEHDVDTLIKQADIAMYRAKEMGRNNFQVYSAQMQSRSFERLTLEAKLRRAVEREELLLHYQPQIDLRSNRIIGVEALLRWQPAGSELIYPAGFMDLAEETGLIVPIGEWVLHAACRQNKAWQLAGFPAMRIAVNYSARQLRQSMLVNQIRGVLDSTALESRYLDIEITEGYLMHNVQTTGTIVKELKAMGINISIDDFGTGYSSLGYLKCFPLDMLKIDQSFMRNVDSDPHDAAIATTIITLAHSLHFKVTAEGVETAEQVDFLRSKNCDYVQGNLFSLPLLADDFTRLLQQQSINSGKKSA